MQTLNNGFVAEELARMNGNGPLQRSNVTLPGEEVPPSVRARMSPEALAIELEQNFQSEEQRAFIHKATIVAQALGKPIDQVTAEDMTTADTAKAERRFEPSEDIRLKHEAAARSVPAPPPANTASVPAPAPTPPAPTPPKAAKATTTFGATPPVPQS